MAEGKWKNNFFVDSKFGSRERGIKNKTKIKSKRNIKNIKKERKKESKDKDKNKRLRNR